MGVFRIRFSAGMETDLKRIALFHRNRILDDIEAQLTHKPTTPTRNRKLLANLLPPWEARSVVWELRSGEYRIFYDVDEAEQTVYVRAVRKNAPGKSTEEII